VFGNISRTSFARKIDGPLKAAAIPAPEIAGWSKVGVCVSTAPGRVPRSPCGAMRPTKNAAEFGQRFSGLANNAGSEGVPEESALDSRRTASRRRRDACVEASPLREARAARVATLIAIAPFALNA
jgi:hypothetical protein